MSSNYKLYFDYLDSFAATHSLAVQIESNIYPLFKDLKRLINHYYATIEKFSNIQNELISFIERLNYDDNDFDIYQSLFKDLLKVDDLLIELKAKEVPLSIDHEIQDFISYSYKNASLFNLDLLEEQVLSKINLTFETHRANKPNKPSGCLGLVLLFVIPIAILSFTIYL